MGTKYHYNTDVLTREDALSFYLLGVFCTDGNVGRCNNSDNSWRFAMNSVDEEWIRSIKDLFSKEKPLEKDKNRNRYTFRLHDKTICDWLIEHGCVPRKTFTLQFPDIPIEYVPDFMRGCIDGDGSIMHYEYKTSKRIKIKLTSASKSFVEDFQCHLSDYDISSSLYTISAKGAKARQTDDRIIQQKSTTYDLIVRSKEALKMIDVLYYNDDVMCLDRKRNKAQSIVDYYASRI